MFREIHRWNVSGSEMNIGIETWQKNYYEYVQSYTWKVSIQWNISIRQVTFVIDEVTSRGWTDVSASVVGQTCWAAAASTLMRTSARRPGKFTNEGIASDRQRFTWMDVLMTCQWFDWIVAQPIGAQTVTPPVILQLFAPIKWVSSYLTLQRSATASRCSLIRSALHNLWHRGTVYLEECVNDSVNIESFAASPARWWLFSCSLSLCCSSMPPSAPSLDLCLRVDGPCPESQTLHLLWCLSESWWGHSRSAFWAIKQWPVVIRSRHCCSLRRKTYSWNKWSSSLFNESTLGSRFVEKSRLSRLPNGSSFLSLDLVLA